jgi:predicted permease
MDALLQDVRHAARGLARSPGFTAAALLTLAIGTGANATVFGFVNALLLRPAPVVRDPGSLYSVFTSDFSSGPYGGTSYPDFLSIRAAAPAFEDVAAFSEETAVLQAGRATERVRVAEVTPGFFALIGVPVSVGRPIAASDQAAGAPPVAVIGDHLWRRTFAAASTVVGRVVSLNGAPFTVIGVAPPRFNGLDIGVATDVWTPLLPHDSRTTSRGSRWLGVVARIRPGTSITEAQSQLDTIASRLARDYPETNRGTLARPAAPRPFVVLRHSRLHPRFRGMVSMLAAVLMTAVGIVLLVACANVAALLLSRGAARRKDILVRQALGASRGRLLRHLITESILIGAAGGIAGVLFALWTSEALPSFFPPEQARLLDAHVDARVVAFTMMLSIAAAATFGLVPALQVTRRNGGAGLRGGTSDRATDRRTGFLRSGLVAAQIALTFVLVVSCGLLVRTLTNVLQGDLGFGTRDAVVAGMELPETVTTEEGAIAFEQVVERVRSLPGVEAVSVMQMLPLAGRSRRGFRIEGYQPRPGEDTELNTNRVDHRYFATMRIPVVAGRAFDARDRAGATPVAVVNDALAQRYFGGDAVGRRLEDSRGTTLQIVGVVRTAKHRSVQEEPLPVVFYPLAQSYSPRVTLVARTSGDAAAYADTVRRAMQDAARAVAVFRVMTLADHVSESLGAERLTAALLTISGAMTMALATVGVYGVIAYGVVRRRKEIGVRVALGALPRDIVRLVMAEGVRVTVVGVGAGAIAAFGGTRFLASFLFGVAPRDAATFAAAATLLISVALVAAWLPARRAVRLDPVAALRQD